MTEDGGRRSLRALLPPVLFYLAVAVPLLLAAAAIHYADAYTERAQWQSRQQASLRVATEALFESLPEAASDLTLLNETVIDEIDGPDAFTHIARHFARFARHRGLYDQVRFIDPSGLERVRVNFREGRATRVAVGALQDKADTGYVAAGMDLARHDVYLSRFELNEERGRVEEPHRPTMRLVQAVFDEAGHRRGLIVLNLDGRVFLEPLYSRDEKSPLRYWLIDSHGHWIYSDDPETTWGAQLPHGRRLQDLPDLAEMLDGAATGLVLTPRGQFAYNRVSLDGAGLPPIRLQSSNARFISAEPEWTLVTLVYDDLLYASSQARLRIMTAVVALALLALVPGAVLWGRARERTRRQKRRADIYAQVIEQSDELIYVTDPDGTILFANPAVERLTGYAREEIVGNTPRLFKSGRQGAAFYSALWEKVRNGQPFRSVFVNRRKDGTLFYENKIISPLVDETGAITHLVSTGRDITTDQERQEREMHLADQLSLQLSHHFNNLLAPIINYSEMAASTAEENQQAEIHADIEKVLTGANRLREVLIKISAMSLGAKVSQAVQPVASALCGIVEIERATLPERIALALELDDGLETVGVEFDDLPLMLNELVGNAADAITGPGRIVLAARLVTLEGEAQCITCGEPLNGTFVDISVADTGRGMAQHELDQAFDPFFSTKQAARRVGETLGIGLSRVRNRVHASGGHILVETGPGRGTTVRIICPVHNPDDPPGDAPPPPIGAHFSPEMA